MKYSCNPLNINYRYQFNADPREHGQIQVCREAADPSMICFEGRYYIFASMTLGVWVSEDLVNWENHRLPDDLPLYDYAPDVRVKDGWVWLCASKNDANCDRWRTKDILHGPYGQKPCVSGLRVFGLGEGEKPGAPTFTARRTGDLDMNVKIHPQGNTLGYNILFGESPEKLYHSYMLFHDGDQRVGALIRGRDYFVRVDAFNECGITEGTCVKL